MKIAFIVPSLANRGPLVFTKYLIESLNDLVETIHVYYFEDCVELDFGVPCYKISFWEKIHFNDYDIIHSTMAISDLYCSLNREKIVKSKWVISMHNYFINDVTMLYGKSLRSSIIIMLWKYAFSKANNIIVSSKKMNDYYLKTIGQKKYEIIPYGISYKLLTPIDHRDHAILSTLKSSYTIIGSVGLVIQRKGFAQLIPFLQKHINYAVVIIGNGNYWDALHELIRESGLVDRFILLGFKNNSIDYYNYFDIYATTSYSEGFGLAMLEAMSHKLPVVCSRLEIYEEYFSDDTICLFNPDDSLQLEQAILKATYNKEQYKNSSYNLFLNSFSLKAMGDHHIAYYSEVTKNEN